MAAATELFCRDGYPAVSMADVAAAVGVQPSALYRHFRDKQDLLLETVRTSMEPGASIVLSSGEGLDGLLSVLAESALAHRPLGVLWQRESRHLSSSQRSELRQKVRTVSVALRDAIVAERNELDEAQADFMSGCVLAVLVSVSYQKAQLPRADHAALLQQLTTAVTRVQLPPMRDAGRPGHTPAGLRSRREVLLASAAQLWSRRGFDEVGIDEIAAAASIAPPSFYHHFKGKSDLLWSILMRGDAALRNDMVRALRRSADPQDAARRAMRAYIDLALDRPELVDATVWQVAYLPPDRRERALDIQRDLVGEWMALQERARPDMDRAHVRVRVQAALTVISNVATTRRLCTMDGSGDALTSAVEAVLDVASDPRDRDGRPI